MSEFFVLIKKDLLEQSRSRKLLILSILFLFVAIGSPITAKLIPTLLKNVSTPGLTINIPEPTYHDAIDQFIKNTSQIAILVVIFVASGAIVDEKTRKNLEIVLTKPVSRINFIASKFTSYLGTLALVFAISSIIFYFYTIHIFTAFNPSHFVLMTALVLLYMLMIAAITLLASSVAKNSIGAAGLGFIAYILFGIIVSLIKSLKDYSPDYILSHYKDVINSGWNQNLLWPIVIGVFILLLSFALSVLAFKRQEIER